MCDLGGSYTYNVFCCQKVMVESDVSTVKISVFQLHLSLRIVVDGCYASPSKFILIPEN